MPICDIRLPDSIRMLFAVDTSTMFENLQGFNYDGQRTLNNSLDQSQTGYMLQYSISIDFVSKPIVDVIRLLIFLNNIINVIRNRKKGTKETLSRQRDSENRIKEGNNFR